MKIKMRRETAKEITAIAGVLSYISGFLYEVVNTGSTNADATTFGVVGGIIASIFGVSGAQHVAREHVRRRAKKDADGTGATDYASMTDASSEQRGE